MYLFYKIVLFCIYKNYCIAFDIFFFFLFCQLLFVAFALYYGVL